MGSGLWPWNTQWPPNHQRPKAKGLTALAVVTFFFFSVTRPRNLQDATHGSNYGARCNLGRQ
jgi:hypothetical protein